MWRSAAGRGEQICGEIRCRGAYDEVMPALRFLPPDFAVHAVLAALGAFLVMAICGTALVIATVIRPRMRRRRYIIAGACLVLLGILGWWSPIAGGVTILGVAGVWLLASGVRRENCEGPCCRRCGYILIGMVSERCPECGIGLA